MGYRSFTAGFSFVIRASFFLAEIRFQVRKDKVESAGLDRDCQARCFGLRDGAFHGGGDLSLQQRAPQNFRRRRSSGLYGNFICFTADTDDDGRPESRYAASRQLLFRQRGRAYAKIYLQAQPDDSRVLLSPGFRHRSHLPRSDSGDVHRPG